MSGSRVRAVTEKLQNFPVVVLVVDIAAVHTAFSDPAILFDVMILSGTVLQVEKRAVAEKTVHTLIARHIMAGVIPAFPVLKIFKRIHIFRLFRLSTSSDLWYNHSSNTIIFTEEKSMAFVLTCSSTVDLSEERLSERNIKWASFHFQIDGQDYLDNYGRSMSLEEFYRREREGATPTTSQVNTEEYVELWKPLMEEGNDILHISLSSGISGTYNSANIAADDMRELFPERRIYVMDSLCASAGDGLFVEELADKRDEGMGFDELIEYGESIKLNVNHWFFASDLTSLIRGGRLSPAVGKVAGLLNICPIFKVNSEGKLVSVSKVRTKKKVYQEIVRVMSQHAENGTDYDGRCYISYSDCPDDANEVKKRIEETFPKLRDGGVELFRIGTTIGAHTGVGTVALFFMGDERTE